MFRTVHEATISLAAIQRTAKLIDQSNKLRGVCFCGDLLRNGNPVFALWSHRKSPVLRSLQATPQPQADLSNIAREQDYFRICIVQKLVTPTDKIRVLVVGGEDTPEEMIRRGGQCAILTRRQNR